MEVVNISDETRATLQDLENNVENLINKLNKYGTSLATQNAFIRLKEALHWMQEAVILEQLKPKEEVPPVAPPAE